MKLKKAIEIAELNLAAANAQELEKLILITENEDKNAHLIVLDCSDREIVKSEPREFSHIVKKAKKAILLHNHFYGNPNPSEEDKKGFKTFKTMCSTLETKGKFGIFHNGAINYL